MKNKKIIVLLIGINIILIGIICSLISKNGNIIKEKQIIKEMNESTQVTDLNNQITALNAEHTEYMNYIQTCKTKIATALTNEGVPTSDQATLETMAGSISNVLQARTKDATATADNITEGKTAYVNGQLITGTGADNNSYYNSGYADGLAKINNASITYTYHSHNDNCYETATCRATPSERYIGGRTWIGYSHSACGQAWSGVDWKDDSSDYSGNYSAYNHEYKKLICGKDENDIEKAVITY